MENIAPAIIGLICIVIGIFNRKGNISMLHSYHIKRVSEENRLPFGKMVGTGTIIIGASVIAMSIFSFVAKASQQNVYSVIGTVILIAGLVIGIGITFYAMFKYNKGIF